MAVFHYVVQPAALPAQKLGLLSSQPVEKSAIALCRLVEPPRNMLPQMKKQADACEQRKRGVRMESISESDEDGSPNHAAAALADEFGGCPLKLRDSAERAEEVRVQLQEGNRLMRSRMVQWLAEAAVPLSLSKHGCRLMQVAIEVASGTGRERLVNQLRDSVCDLYKSPHGNHVLCKLIEVLPAASVGFVLDAICGKATSVAKHRFGCRVLERLIEHCTESQLTPLIEELVQEAEPLSRHEYGNFVVQHLLEYFPATRSGIMARLLASLSTLAMHRAGCHVVVHALHHCSPAEHRAMLERLMSSDEAPALLAEIACSRFGSLVVEELADVPACVTEARSALTYALPHIVQTECGLRVAQRFGLVQVDASDATEQLLAAPAA